ncbi:formimidoylglutamate deiminase [Caballeronia insecticola]|uniref:Formiminoglutamate deiminase n=1 Tax=Caballeronia insecticola TaxID=758793 RepID=R4WKI9_9BURK|nr:formimidoylglutamate deiminase [Caballeronia insecticola]BAN25068.1 formiminoglutamate deiminase [Caballeronia insecticola]
MNAAPRAFFADHARLADGWQRDVLFEWDENGALVRVTPDSAAPAGVERAQGPVVPGMPNLHSHAFQRAMAGLTEYRASATDTFWSWRDLMYRFAAKIGPESLGDIARWLYIEMLKAGYTSVCEFHYVHHAPDGAPYANRAELAERVVDAAASAGIGITMLPVLYEYSGFNQSAPRDDQRRFLNTPDSLLALIDALTRSRPENGTRRYGVAPHSLRAVSGESLAALIEGLDARLQRAPVHIHISEQVAEIEACLAATGQRPVEWLLDRFDVDERWCLVHATHIDAGECARLAASGAIAGLCLTTEANLGDGVFPSREYLDAGGRIGVGSDSHIGVDWRSELRLLEYGQRLWRRQRNVLASSTQSRPADRLFDAALDGGAHATGRAVGMLAPGKRADWLVLDDAHPGIGGHAPETWLSSVIFGEHGESPIRDVFVGGRKVIAARRHAQEDESLARYRAALRGLLG